MILLLIFFSFFISDVHSAVKLASPSNDTTPKNIKRDPSSNPIDTIAKIKQRGQLVVLMTNETNNPLFQMHDEQGNAVGQDIDMANNIATALKVKLVIKNDYKAYDDVVNAIAAGEGDIAISKLSYTVERSEKVLYTNPYVSLKKAILINRSFLAKHPDAVNLRSLFDTPSARIGVLAKTSYAVFAPQLFPNATIVQDTEWDKGLIPMLADGKIDAVVRDDARIRILLKQKPQYSLGLLPVTIKGEEDPLMMVVNKMRPDFVVWLNAYLSNNFKIMTVTSLLNKYGKYVK